MRYVFGFVFLVLSAVILQTAVVPAFLPPVLRPDVGILIGLVTLALAPRSFALVLLFGLGLQADLFGSARFGLLTLSYLLAAAVILRCAWRELSRGDLFATWLGAVAGTGVAHLFYVLIGRYFCGLDVSWGPALATWLALVLSAFAWGLPCAYVCGHCLHRLGLLTPGVQERWNTASRQSAARKGKLQRGF